MEDKRELYISMSQALYLQPFVKERERARKKGEEREKASPDTPYPSLRV